MKRQAEQMIDMKRQAEEEIRASFPVMSSEELAQLTLPFSSAKSFGEHLRKVLKENGVAVVTGILDEKQCTEFKDWKKAELEMPSPQPGAMSHVQGEIAWKARLHPRVLQSFAHIFETPVLSVSTDITSMFYAEEGSPAASDDKQWLHVDQNSKTGMVDTCYQGILYIRPSAGEDSSTTVVWPRSHLDSVCYGDLVGDEMASHKAFQKDPATGVLTGHFLPLNGMRDDGKRQRLLEQALAGSRRVPVPAGSLLLWNSRTVHQGWKGGPRFAIPVCWEPRERVSKAATERKLVIAAAGLGTSHSPAEGRLHPNASRRRGDAVKMESPCARPFVVKPAEELSDSAWKDLFKVWQGKQFAEDVIPLMDPTACAAALKPEVAMAL